MNGTGKSLAYIGAGGTIGSSAVNTLARNGCIEHLTLIDPDVYEPHNLASQDISVRDVGRLKVDVQAARIRRVNPRLLVEAIAEPVERVPVVRLRANVLATGLDGLAPRRWVNRVARRLGIPLVDAGVRAEGRLVRIDVFEPTPEAACLECGWTEQERASLDTRYPCDRPVVAAPTGAPAYLGGLAASVQVAECVKLLRGDTQNVLLGRQVMIDVTNHRYYVSARRRSPDCTFDHRAWLLRPLDQAPGKITVRQALRLVPSSSDLPTRLRVDGDVFVHRLECPECNAARQILFLAGRIVDGSRVCTHCGTKMVAPGIYLTDSVCLEHLTGARRRLSLHALGLRAGDVFGIEASSGESHFEIGGR